MQKILIGTDIIEIARVQKAVEREHFLERIFSPIELDYYKNKGSKAETLAGMFCAKEAASKALGTGIVGFGFCDIQVSHTISGAPFLEFLNGAKVAFAGFYASISISHCNEYATAVCLLQKD